MEKDHLEILLEDMRGKFDLVLEGHEVLRSEIQRAREESKERDDHLLFLLQTLDRKIESVDARLSAKIDSGDSHLSAKIDSVESRLNAKIESVESRLSAKIDALAEDLAEHRRDTEAHGAA
ncbi:MAG: hypothetical protein HY900_03510 [Deltaproteobacteria bacterium]|nr:hypothetical protein [Deltaproteobacteria bacterium]